MPRLAGQAFGSPWHAQTPHMMLDLPGMRSTRQWSWGMPSAVAYQLPLPARLRSATI